LFCHWLDCAVRTLDRAGYGWMTVMKKCCNGRPARSIIGDPPLASETVGLAPNRTRTGGVSHGVGPAQFSTAENPFASNPLSLTATREFLHYDTKPSFVAQLSPFRQ
jgi:hypothetical protein